MLGLETMNSMKQARELAALIVEAREMADALGLSLVAIRLSEALDLLDVDDDPAVH